MGHITDIVLAFEGKDALQQVVGRWPLLSYRDGLERVEPVSWNKSFGALTVAVAGPLAHTAHLIVDGCEHNLLQIGGILMGKVPLDNDLCFHRLAVICPAGLALTLDVAVEHLYFPVNCTLAESGLSKWSTDVFRRELLKHKDGLAIKKQQAVRSDWRARGLSAGKDAYSDRLLYQVLGRIDTLLAEVSRSEVLVDFASTIPGDFDRDGILAALKRDHRYLTEDPEGSITVSERRYATLLNHRVASRSATPNMSPVADLLELCAAALRSTGAPDVAQYMLAATLDAVRHRFSCKVEIASGGYEAVLDMPMKSSFGIALQSQLGMLVALVTNLLARDPLEQGLLWLEQSIRDFDVFEVSAFACCAKALGFSQAEISSSRGLLERDGLVVANANLSMGRERFSTSLSGWRDKSKQPSDYRPDIFVSIDGAPVIVDAKFRLPPSANLLVEPEALKEVQAYLDEYGLPAAVIVVPRILSQDYVGADGVAVIEGFTDDGKTKRVLVVELQDSDDSATQERMKKAVELAAHTAPNPC